MVGRGGGGQGPRFFSCSFFPFPFRWLFAFRLLDVSYAGVDLGPPADSTQLDASHTTLSRPNELMWSNRGSFAACRLRKVPRMRRILGANIPRLSYHRAGFEGAVETGPTRVTQIEVRADSAIYVEDACPLCFHPLACHLHDVRRIDNRSKILGSCTLRVPR